MEEKSIEQTAGGPWPVEWTFDDDGDVKSAYLRLLPGKAIHSVMPYGDNVLVFHEINRNGEVVGIQAFEPVPEGCLCHEELGTEACAKAVSHARQH